jgi:hypothetical protein
MAKITRLSESSHVTTVVGNTGDPEVVPLLDNPTDEVVEGDEYDFEVEPVDVDVNPGLFSAEGGGEVEQGEQPPVDGTIDDVKTWVGDDYVKAERALSAEVAGKNRSGLVSWLEKVAAAR